MGEKSLEIHEPYDPNNSAISNFWVKMDETVNKNNRVFDIAKSIKAHKSLFKDTKKRNNEHSTGAWWDPVIENITPIIFSARNVRNPELEMRLGRITSNGDFKSGVSREWFEYHISKMESFKGWTNDPIWQCMEEYIFNERRYGFERNASEGIRLRKEPGGLSTFVKKATVDHCDLPLKGADYDLRLMLKTETPYHLKCGRPVWIRFKERKSFRYKNMMVFDFTKVWEGKSLELARQAKAKYEIEVECINYERDNLYIAQSFMLKCSDLLRPPRNKKPRHVNEPNYQQPNYQHNLYQTQVTTEQKSFYPQPNYQKSTNVSFVKGDTFDSTFHSHGDQRRDQRQDQRQDQKNELQKVEQYVPISLAPEPPKNNIKRNVLASMGKLQMPK